MFQFTYKLRVTERVKGKCERHPRYNRSGTGAAESRVDARPATLSSTCIRRGYRLTPHIGSFYEEHCRGPGFVCLVLRRNQSNTTNPSWVVGQFEIMWSLYRRRIVSTTEPTKAYVAALTRRTQ